MTPVIALLIFGTLAIFCTEFLMPGKKPPPLLLGLLASKLRKSKAEVTRHRSGSH